MTKYIFTSDNGIEWTEEEKQLCIKRHEQQQKRFQERWEIKVSQTIGEAFFHKMDNTDLKNTVDKQLRSRGTYSGNNP